MILGLTENSIQLIEKSVNEVTVMNVMMFVGENTLQKPLKPTSFFGLAKLAAPHASNLLKND